MSTGSATKKALCLPFPIRSGFDAQIVVPRDMTAHEADRLCAFVRSLAMPATTTSDAGEQQGGSDADGG